MKGIQKLPEQNQLGSLFPIVDHWNPFGSYDGRQVKGFDPRSTYMTTSSPSGTTSTSTCTSKHSSSHPVTAMKPTDLFRDQVNALWSCFKDWNECEQTLVLYSLLKGVSGTQAKFLSLVLDQALAESDLQHVEREANDPDFVRSLNNESKEEAMAQVLSHLPLLQPSSTEAKGEYLKLIPEILSYMQDKGILLEEAHQLFTYLVIHPALSSEEQIPRSKWINQFDDQQSFPPTSCYSSQLGSEQLVSPFLKPSPYTPQVSEGTSTGLLRTGMYGDWCQGGGVVEGGGGGGGGLLVGSNSFHQPLTTTMSAPPAVNVTGSSEDGHHGKGKRNSFLEEKSGMKDVPTWLKSLRLHKYTSLFESLDYDEMMALTEKQLEDMDVTKGARNKIMLSIQKLKERQPILRNLEKDIMSTGSSKNLRNALNDIKNIINTPIHAFQPKEIRSSNSNSSSKPDDIGTNPAGVVGDMRPETTSSESEQGSMPVQEGDLPGQITRLMGKMCTQLLMSPRPHEETITQYLQLLDKCYNHEAFTSAQKSKLLSWRKNCQKFSPHPYARKTSLDSKQTRGWGHYTAGFSEHSGGTTGVSVGGRRPVSRQPFGGMSQPHINPLLSMSSLGNPNQTYRQSPGSNMYLHRQSLGGNPHSMVQRTKSAPNHRRASQPTPPTYSPQHPPLTRVETPLHSLGEPDITDRLEMLCRSVTEHALGDEADHNGEIVRH